jgi:hypothetical protein
MLSISALKDPSAPQLYQELSCNRLTGKVMFHSQSPTIRAKKLIFVLILDNSFLLVSPVLWVHNPTRFIKSYKNTMMWSNTATVGFQFIFKIIRCNSL